MTISRLTRLCLKELRESLRDRRTIVTLLLMPMMVYPLLSLVLSRVVPTKPVVLTDRTVRIGISKQLRDSGMESILLIGYSLLHNPDTSPVFIDTPRAEWQNGSSSTTTAALPIPQFVQLLEGDRQSLKRDIADVVVVGRLSEEVDAAVIQKVAEVLRPMVTQLSKEKGLPADLNLDLSQLARSLGKYEIAYRFGDLQSERGFALVEQSLMALNAMVGSTGSGVKSVANYTYSISGSPLLTQSESTNLLGTLIPLVLVLMTMAGAVYPAIDLTAGERERGTMEALVVSPTPTVWILFSKYVAVVTVALLTALANLGAMTLTLWLSGMGAFLFGDAALTPASVGQVLVLLILLALFFAALLLAVTSFARSFKEAQAYLIPLMLLAMTPGVTSLMPGIHFTSVMAAVPLVNIVLLAREVLQGDPNLPSALVTVICNGVYAMASLMIASRLFGAGPSTHGSNGLWRDWLIRPRRTSARATPDQMGLILAVIFPVSFVASSILTAKVSSLPIRQFLGWSALVTISCTVLMPLAICWHRRLRFFSTFQLGVWKPRFWIGWVGIGLIAIGTWVVQHELVVLSQRTGLGIVTGDRMLLASIFEFKFQTVPIWLIFLQQVILPALVMEFLFRGLVLTSMLQASRTAAIAISAVLFALFEMLNGQALSLELFLPMVAIGILLGWLAFVTSSIWPGVIARLLVLGVPQILDYFQSSIPLWQVIRNQRVALPVGFTLFGLIVLALGMLIVFRTGRTIPDKST